MNYPIVLHKDSAADFGVSVPDLPGCFSAGATIDEAVDMAKEAIELHLEGLIEEGEPMPRPSSIEEHKKNTAYKNGIWAIVSINPSGLRLNSKRINITMPERVLEAVDQCALREGETRSGLLVKVVSEYMGRQRIETRQGRRTKKTSKKL